MHPATIVFIIINLSVVACVMLIKKDFVFKGYVQYEIYTHVTRELSPESGDDIMGFCPKVCVDDKACLGFEICRIDTLGKCRLSNGNIVPSINDFTQCGYYEKTDHIIHACDALSTVLTCLEHNAGTSSSADGIVIGTFLNCSDCDCVSGYTDVSGVYQIHMLTDDVTVECVMTGGYGYTVILQRHDGSVNFNRTYSEYENGFGSPFTEMWLGNKYFAPLTSSWVSGLRIELVYSDSSFRYVDYSDIYVNSGSQYYYLELSSGYSGNASNMLSTGGFGTYDFDPESCGCPGRKSGGWWHGCCSSNCSLTSPYNDPAYRFGWDCEAETTVGLISAKMMLRRG